MRRSPAGSAASRRFSHELQALREQVGGGFIARFVDQWKQSACGAHHRFLPRNQLLDDYRCWRHAGFLRNAGETGELCIRARCRMPECANRLCDQIQRAPKRGVLFDKHQLQRVEHRARHVPVKAVSFDVERGAVCQQAGQPSADQPAPGIGFIDRTDGFRLAMPGGKCLTSGTTVLLAPGQPQRKRP